MLGKTLAALLVLTMSTVGIAPCFGMAMDVRAEAAEHRCCEGESCPEPGDEPVWPSPSMPKADCCVIGSVPDPRPPAERTAAEAIVRLAPTASPLPALWLVPVLHLEPAPDPPPGSPGIARHLFLSVLLI